MNLQKTFKLEKLIGFSENLSNIAEEFDKEDLKTIGTRVINGFDIDDSSLDKWKEKNKDAVELAMQIDEVKNTPWENAANVKYPIIAVASLQFSSRVMPNIIRGNNPVKGRPVGADPDGDKAARAMRVSEHMSYQLTEEQEAWIDDQDKLMTSLPVYGCMFKKTYYSPLLDQNVSERIMPEDCVVHYYTKSLESAPRITHKIELYPNDIEERKRNGTFLEDFDFRQSYSTLASEKPDISGDNRLAEDKDAPHVFLEQHRWLDLDDDGYKEPYIVTVHKTSNEVVRIIARFESDGVQINAKGKVIKIDPVHYFTKTPFIPAIDGSFYDTGFGHLLSPLNKSVNQILNQLLDAGTLANLQIGFLGRGIQLNKGKAGGDLRMKPGEWRNVNISGDDLRKGIFPLPVKEPSMVLFQLLGFVVGAAEKLASVTDVLTGESPGQDVPATTTLALIEQGLKVFNAIYGRIHRALKSEYKKLFRLNSIYLDDESYFYVTDDQRSISKTDYNAKDCDVVPVSNPAEVTDTQRLIKSQAMNNFLGRGLNDQEITLYQLEALDIPDIKRFTEVPEQPPNPEIVMMEREQNLKEQELAHKIFASKYDAMKIQSEVILNLAKAEAEEAGTQMNEYMNQMSILDRTYNTFLKERSGNGNSGGGVQGLETTQGNAGNNQNGNGGIGVP